MQNLYTLVIVAAAVAFALAVLGTFGFRVLDVPAEAYSRACSNLTLLVIASHLVLKKQ